MGSEETLREAFGALKGSVEQFQKNWQVQDNRAAQGRKYLYEKMETVSREVQGISHKVDTVTAEVAAMRPAVADWIDSKNQAIGARVAVKFLIRFLWSIGGAIVVGAAWLIEHLLLH